jgi:hypothetical protein
VVIHLVFVGSGTILALTDRIAEGGKVKGPGKL